MIPKTIHYCWFGKKKIPREVKRSIESWKRFCPEYKIICWTEDNFDVWANPFCASAYKAGAWAFVSDFARLKVVFDHGGIYLDTDVELLKSLDSLLANSFYIGVEQEGKYCTTGLGFGASKQNRIVERLMEKYDSLLFSDEKRRELACPMLNNEVLAELGYTEYVDQITYVADACILPCRYLDPIAPGEASENLLCNETVSIHHYSNSWGSRSDVARRKLIRALGAERVARAKGLIRGV